MSTKKTNGRDFLIGSIIGSVAGAITALVLAPKSGKELRNDITEQAGTLKGRAGDMTSQYSEKGMQWKEALTDKVKNMKSGNDQSNDEPSANDKEAEDAAEEVARAIEEAARELEMEQQKSAIERNKDL
ncbi:YtxH domain-containing protein [Terribacillus sp. DMT04]|uniref:YtxH domain-containing protein n=1 Tax=Terribacillus sp. DMT04 TaxID=2850441 RepID=UPI001C2C5EAD|nr:YtxH domain-containing protein [Terribacillus sp. DMT04]QXE00726.1 YtxH domain-containing protein [Terribacillus sp. DMT04]